MTYSGAPQAQQAREKLGNALQALQSDPNIPDDVMAVASNIAQSVGALFEAQNASSEIDGKASIKASLGSLSQTLALLQDVRSKHAGIKTATETIAQVMNLLYPLTTAPSRAPSAAPPAQDAAATVKSAPPAAAQKPASVHPKAANRTSNSIHPPVAPKPTGPRTKVEANIGATTESNFYVGFSGEISEGGVFLSTYEVLPTNTSVEVFVTLPGGFDFKTHGWVRFVRDPFDLSSDSEPGIGIQFESLEAASRDLVLRFVRKRPPMFFED